MSKITSFLNDESGAVTLDWVVLTAVIVTFGFVIFNTVRPATTNVASSINTQLDGAQACLIRKDLVTC